MKKTLTLARPGTYGSRENSKTVTEEDLKEIAESYTPGDSVPVTITENGHPENGANFPKLGDVTNVYYDEETKELRGDVEMNEALAKAFEDGFYDSWSIGAKTNPDGKLYLHHLAFLGEIPPAIKDLREKIKDSLNLDFADSQEFFFCANFTKENEAEKKLKAIYKERLFKAVAGKIPIPKQNKILSLADSLYREINLTDETGETVKTNIYEVLADCFDCVKLPVKPGILLSDDYTEEEVNTKKRNILSKA